MKHIITLALAASLVGGAFAQPASQSFQTKLDRTATANDKTNFETRYTAPASGDIAGYLMLQAAQKGILTSGGTKKLVETHLQKGGITPAGIQRFLAEFDRQMVRNQNYTDRVGGLQGGLMSAAAAVSALGLAQDSDGRALGIQAGLSLVGQFDLAMDLGRQLAEFQAQKNALTAEVERQQLPR